MCTLTLFHTFDQLSSRSSGFVVTMSRDESEDRDESEPKIFTADNCWQTWHPVDGRAGGTWFGVHRKGWALALLNRYQDQQILLSQTTRNLPSRGQIIPQLLNYERYQDVALHLKQQSYSQYAPFDLWLMSEQEYSYLSWDGVSQTLQQESLLAGSLLTVDQTLSAHSHVTSSQGALFTYSSSTDFDEAGEYRRAQFSRIASPNVLHNPKNQTAEKALDLHTARYAENPSLSINMNRPDRHTKSICQAVFQNGNASPRIQYLRRTSDHTFVPYAAVE